MESSADGRTPWLSHVARLAQLRDAIQSGQQDPLELSLERVVQETVQAFGSPPEDFHEQEVWLGAAGEALRLASELLAAKARRLAPEPQGIEQAEAAAQQAAAEEALAGEEAMGPGSEEEGPGTALEELARRAEAYQRFKEAARLLEQHAEAWSRHQPRQAPSALLETLQRVLGPWPDGMPQVSADRLVEALEKVLQRTRMAERARHAPAPGFDWEDLLARVRQRTEDASGPVDLTQFLAQEARHRTEVIGLFLAVLELLRVGELWLTEQGGSIWIRRRR